MDAENFSHTEKEKEREYFFSTLELLHSVEDNSVYLYMLIYLSLPAICGSQVFFIEVMTQSFFFNNRQVNIIDLVGQIPNNDISNTPKIPIAFGNA